MIEERVQKRHEAEALTRYEVIKQQTYSSHWEIVAGGLVYYEAHRELEQLRTEQREGRLWDCDLRIEVNDE